MDIFTIICERADIQPDQPAYVSPQNGSQLTYRNLVGRAKKIAASFEALGCCPGERCGIILDDEIEFLTTALGILAAKLCLVPIGAFLPGEEKEYVIRAAKLHWICRENGRFERILSETPIDGNKDNDFRKYEPAYIRFTSGTTGRRKGILLGHQAVVERLRAADAILRIRPEDRIWFALPMADHFVVSVLLYLSRGATILARSESEFWPFIAARERPTVIYGAPDFYESLCRSEIASLDSLRLAISTTAPLSQNGALEFAKRFNKNLNPALGIIEVGLLTINTRPDKPGSVGPPMPDYTVTIVGEKGEPVGRGEPGEIHIEGPGLLSAYLEPWRPASKILQRYGFPTGDYGRFDAEGYLYLVGRGKNRLQVGGIEFFCEEVEAVLNTLPGVTESRVFLESGSKTLTAEVVGSSGRLKELPELLRERIDWRKVPEKFLLVDSLPRTPNGKLKRG